MKSFKKFLSVQEAKAGYCSDECCGSDVKAEDCPCPPTCPHCDCNAETNEAFDPKHPKVVAARKAHKAGTYNGNVDKNGNAIVHIDGKPHTVTKGDPAAKTEAIEEGILDNIKKKANDVRRKVVGPNQAEKDAARKKQMAKQHDSTMNNIAKAMSAVAKKDKAAEVARLNKRNEETEQLDELSPETLKSYKKKATKQYKQSANKRMPGGGDYGSATKAAQDKHQKRFDKRHKGIGSEIKRTTDSDIHLKDPKGLVRKDPKSNSMTGKPAPYKNRAESLDEDTINQLTAEYVNEHNITMVELEAMSPEQLDEIIGKALGGIAKAAIKTGAAAIRGGKAATQRVSTAGRADAAEKKAGKLEKKKADRDRIQAAKDRVKAARDSLRKKQAAAAS